MYRKRKQGRLNRKVAHTGISLLHFPSALPEPALPPLLRTTLRAGGDTLSHLISFLYHRWCAVRPGASEAPRLRAETHSGVQARPYGRGLLRSRVKVRLETAPCREAFAFSAVAATITPLCSSYEKRTEWRSQVFCSLSSSPRRTPSSRSCS